MDPVGRHRQLSTRSSVRSLPNPMFLSVGARLVEHRRVSAPTWCYSSDVGSCVSVSSALARWHADHSVETGLVFQLPPPICLRRSMRHKVLTPRGSSLESVLPRPGIESHIEDPGGIMVHAVAQSWLTGFCFLTVYVQHCQSAPPSCFGS